MAACTAAPRLPAASTVSPLPGADANPDSCLSSSHSACTTSTTASSTSGAVLMSLMRLTAARAGALSAPRTPVPRPPVCLETARAGTASLSPASTDAASAELEPGQLGTVTVPGVAPSGAVAPPLPAPSPLALRRRFAAGAVPRSVALGSASHGARKLPHEVRLASLA